MVSKKVILVGHFGVGKTSLISRFVHQKFSDQYLTTIGVKIDKKAVHINGAELPLIIWDIAGETSQQKIPESYKLGANGVIHVFDLSRPSTYENLQSDTDNIRDLLPNVPITQIGNKNDLIDDNKMKAIKKNTAPQ